MGDRDIPGSKAGPSPHRGYRLMMVRLMSRYPDGVTGAALLLMRLSCAIVVFPGLGQLALTRSGSWLAASAAAALSLALAAGFATRSAAVLLVFGLAASTLGSPAGLAFLLMASAGGAAALALLGPGAYSIDARLVGRRVIRLDPRSPDRGRGS